MSDQAWTHESSVTIAAPPPRVFVALTDADELRQWFAEHAALADAPGGPWQFWGRHTLGAPAAPHPGDRLTVREPSTHLGYTWILEGCSTNVSLRLEEHREGDRVETRLALRHTLSGPLPHPRPRELVDDFWRLSFGNLSAHLAGGEGMVRPDFTDPHPEIRLSIVIAAPPEAVFSALLDPEALREWVGATAPVVEPRVGGVYRYGWQYPVDGRPVDGGPMIILELVPNRLLVTDWPDWRGDPAVPMQRIEWHLESVANGTRVTLVHAGFTRATDISDFPFGWAEFAGALKGYVEGRSG